MIKRALQRTLALAVLAGATSLLAGCPATLFYDEGPGQPGDKASGLAPPGSVGVCRVRLSRKPPLVNGELWRNMPMCNKRTPRRYLRIGYGRIGAPSTQDTVETRRIDNVMSVVKEVSKIDDGNRRMLGMLRTVRREALAEPELASRVERASGRTYACDYSYLLNITNKEYRVLSSGVCPAFAYDAKQKRNVCLFDTSIDWATWLTSAWSCMAFTGTVGEGQSCYRLCAYDDYCAEQVSCAAPDFDLVLCSLGVCMPEKMRGFIF